MPEKVGEHDAALAFGAASQFCKFVTLAFTVLMDGSPVSISKHEPLDCPRCGTAWHLKRGLCVNCLLSCGLDGEMHDVQTLDDVLDQIDMSDCG